MEAVGWSLVPWEKGKKRKLQSNQEIKKGQKWGVSKRPRGRGEGVCTLREWKKLETADPETAGAFLHEFELSL